MLQRPTIGADEVDFLRLATYSEEIRNQLDVCLEVLLTISNCTFYKYFVILSENVKRIAMSEKYLDLEEVRQVVSVFLCRIKACRGLKLKFLFLLRNEEFNFWKPFLVYSDTDCYVRAKELLSRIREEFEQCLSEIPKELPQQARITTTVRHAYLPIAGSFSFDTSHKSQCGGKIVSSLSFSMSCDYLDLQTAEFFSCSIMQLPLEEKQKLNFLLLAHPLIHDCEFQEHLVSFIEVVTVFSSIAAPAMLALKHQPTGKALGSDLVEVKPRLIVKHGDNLFHDLSVETMFRIFNAIWSSSPSVFPEPSDAPFAVTYEVIPTGNKQGFFEAIEGVVPYKDFRWKEWRCSGNEEAVRHFINSAAGGYIGAYVLGVRDRHWDNILVQNDTTLIQIDFGYLLGSNPPIDAPRFSISKAMKNALHHIGQWDTFVQRCADAHGALRHQAEIVIQTAIYVFGQASYSEEVVQEFLTSSKSLMLSEDDETASQMICSSVRKSPTSPKNLLKQFGHTHIDPVWYGLLKKHFLPAEMIMARVEASQEKIAAKRRASAASTGVAQQGEQLHVSTSGPLAKEVFHKN